MKKTENVYITFFSRGKHSLRRANAKHGSGQAAATVGRKIFCGKSGKTFCDTRTSRFFRRMNSSTRNL